MLRLLLTFATALAAAWLLRKWRRTRGYWARRGVPHAPPHPLLGSLTFLMKRNPGLWMRSVYERFKTPYVGIWLFWRPALVINSPEIARRVLVRDSAVFRDRFLRGGSGDAVGSLIIFTIKDPLWSLIRRRLTPLFTSAKLRSLQAYFRNKSREFVRRVEMEMEKREQVNLRVAFTDLTTDIIGNTTFGVDSEATLTGAGPLRTVTKSFMKFSIPRGLAWCSIFFIPEFADIFGFTFFPKSTTDYLRKIYERILDQRGGYEGEVTDSGDLFDALRKIKRECMASGEDLPKDTLLAQAAAFLQAGFDTTGSALTFCAYELAFHPTAQEEVYNELVKLKQSIGDKDFDEEVLKDATYLNCVIKESLRKYQPMGWLDRVAARDYDIDEHLTIPAGTPVYVNSCGMHHDPEYYPEPNAFRPERFMPENESKLSPLVYLPFGEGPRNCIGVRFALQSMRHVLAELVLNYRLHPIANAPRPNQVKIEEKGFFFFPGEDLYVKFVSRDA